MYAYSGIRNVKDKEVSKRPGTNLEEDHQLSMNVQHSYWNRYKTKKGKNRKILAYGDKVVGFCRHLVNFH